MTNDQRDELLSEMAGDIKLLLEERKDTRKTLYGNGQPGICARVQQNSDSVRSIKEACKKQHEESKDKKSQSLAIYLALGSALISGPIGALLVFWITKAGK